MVTAKRSKYFLSPSGLNLFRDCPHCFWMEKVKKIKRPRGIFPSLPSGMDRVIKTYMDTFREKGTLPPEFDSAEFNGVHLYPQQAKLDEWRNWRAGLRFEDRSLQYVLSGALDDLLVKDDRHIPFDYKTKGSPTTEEDAVRYYQNQLDCYALLLEENSLPVADWGILAYYSPKSVGTEGQVRFQIQIIRLSVDPESARKTIRQAVETLEGPEPAATSECEYCTWKAKFADSNSSYKQLWMKL